MKNTRTFIRAAAAVIAAAALAGCVRDVNPGPCGAGKIPIVLTQAGTQTSRGASVPDGQLADDSTFCVTAYYYPGGMVPAIGTDMSWNGYSIVGGSGVKTNDAPMLNAPYKVVSGQFVSQSLTPFYWPEGQGDKLRFFAWMPRVADVHESAELQPAPILAAAPDEIWTLRYKLPDEVADHHDVLVALTGLKDKNDAATLNFNHTLTRIDFKARRGDGFAADTKVRVKEIVIRDVLKHGLLTVEPNDIENPFAWDGYGDNLELCDLVLSSEGEKQVLKNVFDLNGQHRSLMLAVNPPYSRECVMAIPMDSGEAAAAFDEVTVEVTVSIDGEEETFTLPLAGTDPWAPDKKITYLFTVYPDGVGWQYEIEDWEGPVEIDPGVSNVVLEVSRTTAVINEHTKARIWFKTNQPDVKVEMMAIKYGDGEVMIPFDELDEIFGDLGNLFWELAADGLSGDNPRNFRYWWDEESGYYVGYVDIETDRSRLSVGNSGYLGTFCINAGGLRREITISWENVPRNIFMPSWEDYPYVGAFWRHDQKGERLICGWLEEPIIIDDILDLDLDDTDSIKKILEDIYTNKWTAEVVEGDDFIVLERGKTLDLSVWTYGEPGDAENYPVESTATRISGSGSVYFRIGLTGTIDEEEVRYGLVMVTVLNDVTGEEKEYPIYVRQGEAPDYVLNEGYLFSPYNLTTEDNGPGSGFGVELGTGGGSFTKYPSQLGWYFRWNETTAYSWGGFVSSWPMIYSGPHDWDDDYDACPPGYKRPEIEAFQQSVVAKYDNPVPERNAIEGYYADGHFDRRMINDATYNILTLSTGDASAGILVYESATGGRSIFFPNAGYKQNSIYNKGSYGAYWTATSGASSMFPAFSSHSARGHTDCYATEYHGGTGLPVRCIRE